MEDSWENFQFNTVMECGDDDFMENYNSGNIDCDDFLREILLQTPEQSLMYSESENVNGDVEFVGNMVKSNSSNSIMSEEQEQERLKSKKVVVPRRSSSPTTYILSFDNSTMIPATPEPCVNLEAGNKRDYCSKSDYSKKSSEKGMKTNNNSKNQLGVKKTRSGSQCADHIIAERKRRQELTERFIALSATIPGLSKTDKASILRAAIDYVKQLKERVDELEEKQDKNVGVTSSSLMVLNKINSCEIEDTKNSRDTSCDGDCNNIFPEIEARVMGKEVLIEIHCEKQNGIELKLLDHIETNLQLFVTGNSVLPFGKSAISITIIAQMGDGYKVTVNDLVKSIRQVLLKPQIRCESDPY